MPFTPTTPSDKAATTLAETTLPLHYNLRTFQTSLKTVPITLADVSYHSVGYWVGQPVSSLSAQTISTIGDERWGAGGLTQDELNLLTQDQLNQMTQFQIEGGSPVGPVAAWRYATGLIIDVGVVGQTVNSLFVSDNIMQPPFDVGDHFIELVLRNFPAQAAAQHLDLVNSTITFSSSLYLDPAETDVIPFNASLNSLSAGGNVTWRINRNTLINTDLTSIKRIDLYLVTIGGDFEFGAESMRVVPAGYTYPSYGMDTKEGYLRKNASVNGTGVTAQTSPGPIMNTGTNKVKNLTHIVKFNTGHLPTDPNVNQFTLYYRANTGAGNYIEVTAKLYDDETTIQVFDGGDGIKQLTTDELEENTDYFLEVKLNNDTVNIKLWRAIGSIPVALIADSGDVTTITVVNENAGYVAYDFSGYNADFYIDYMYIKDAALAEMESVTFESITPVKGVSLYTNNSPPAELSAEESSFVEGPAINPSNYAYNESGASSSDTSLIPGTNDVYVTSDTSMANGSASSIKVQKHIGNAFIGGIEYNTPIRIDNLNNSTFQGDLYYDKKLAFGRFRIVLWDVFKENVAFATTIPDLVLNRWNRFRIPVVADRIYNNYFILQIHHVGVNPDANPNSATDVGTFWLDNFSIKSDTVTWEASNDGGLTYIQFFDTINQRYQGVNFPTLDNQLRIRAKAFTTNAWVAGYEAIPQYAQPGRIIE